MYSDSLEYPINILYSLTSNSLAVDQSPLTLDLLLQKD
jgi:hypothetical protein